MAQDNHILFSQVFETVLKPLPKYDVDIVCRDTPTVKKIRNHHRSRQMRFFKIDTRYHLTQARGALGETSNKSDFSLHAWDSYL